MENNFRKMLAQAQVAESPAKTEPEIVVQARALAARLLGEKGPNPQFTPRADPCILHDADGRTFPAVIEREYAILVTPSDATVGQPPAERKCYDGRASRGRAIVPFFGISEEKGYFNTRGKAFLSKLCLLFAFVAASLFAAVQFG